MAKRIRIADDKMMFCSDAAALTFLSDPIPMGENDYVELLWNIALIGESGGTTALVLTLEFSNDGTTWLASGAIMSSQASTPAVPIEVGGFVRAAYFRLKYTLTAGVGNTAWAAFDIHANILKSGT